MKKNILVLPVFAFLLTTSLGNAAGLFESNADDEDEEVLASPRPSSIVDPEEVEKANKQKSIDEGLRKLQEEFLKDQAKYEDQLNGSPNSFRSFSKQAHVQLRADSQQLYFTGWIKECIDATKKHFQACKKVHTECLKKFGANAPQTEKAKFQQQAAEASFQEAQKIEKELASYARKLKKNYQDLRAEAAKKGKELPKNVQDVEQKGSHSGFGRIFDDVPWFMKMILSSFPRF